MQGMNWLCLLQSFLHSFARVNFFSAFKIDFVVSLDDDDDDDDVSALCEWIPGAYWCIEHDKYTPPSLLPIERTMKRAHEFVNAFVTENTMTTEPWRAYNVMLMCIALLRVLNEGVDNENQHENRGFVWFLLHFFVAVFSCRFTVFDISYWVSVRLLHVQH